MLVLCQNCIFVHITDKIFPVTGPSLETHAPHWPLQTAGAIEQPLLCDRQNNTGWSKQRISLVEVYKNC